MARKNIERAKVAGVPAPVAGIASEIQGVFLRRVAAGEPSMVVIADLGMTRDQADEILAQPVAQKWLRMKLNIMLLSEGAPRALQTLIELLGDDQAPAAVRRLAASDIMSRAGFGPAVAASVDDAPTKSASELSTDELHVLISDLQSEIAGRAQDVTPMAPQEKVSNADPLSFLD